MFDDHVLHVMCGLVGNEFACAWKINILMRCGVGVGMVADCMIQQSQLTHHITSHHITSHHITATVRTVRTGGEIYSGVVQQSRGDVVEVWDSALLTIHMLWKRKQREERNRKGGGGA